MNADVLEFGVFANSSRGLMARVILPNNIIAYKEHIQSIGYSVKNRTDNTPAVTGTLDPDDVMFSALQLEGWPSDKIGYTLLWPADGSLWPEADKEYRIALTFVIVNPFPLKPILAGKAFILAYEAETEDPLG